MHFCPECGAERNDPDAQFCHSCGFAFPLRSFSNVGIDHESKPPVTHSNKPKIIWFVVLSVLLILVGGLWLKKSHSQSHTKALESENDEASQSAESEHDEEGISNPSHSSKEHSSMEQGSVKEGQPHNANQAHAPRPKEPPPHKKPFLERSSALGKILIVENQKSCTVYWRNPDNKERFLGEIQHCSSVGSSKPEIQVYKANCGAYLFAVSLSTSRGQSSCMGDDFVAWFAEKDYISPQYEFGGCTTIDSVGIQGNVGSCKIALSEMPQWIQGEKSAGSVWEFSRSGMRWSKVGISQREQNSTQNSSLKESPESKLSEKDKKTETAAHSQNHQKTSEHEGASKAKQSTHASESHSAPHHE